LKLARKEKAICRTLDWAGCYVVVTDVASTVMSTQQVHDCYVSLQKVERDFRTLKTGLLEVRFDAPPPARTPSMRPPPQRQNAPSRRSAT
jgi:hypothetical protein